MKHPYLAGQLQSFSAPCYLSRRGSGPVPVSAVTAKPHLRVLRHVTLVGFLLHCRCRTDQLRGHTCTRLEVNTGQGIPESIGFPHPGGYWSKVPSNHPPGSWDQDRPFFLEPSFFPWNGCEKGRSLEAKQGSKRSETRLGTTNA